MAYNNLFTNHFNLAIFIPEIEEDIPMNEQIKIPVYEVTEVSLEQAILLIASEQEKEQTIYKESAERMLKLCA